jgi:hypothetical protein
MRSSLLATATVICLCSPVSSQVREKATGHVREDLVTRAIQVEHSEWVENAGTRRILRRLLTPDVGSYEFVAKGRRIVVKDTKQVVESFAALVAHFDKAPAVAPRQLLLDIRFVETRNASLWKESIAPAAGATKSDFGSLTAKGAASVMTVVQKDARSSIVRAPKLVALDHQAASVFVGDSSTAASKAQSYRASVVPHIVPGTDRVILEVGEGKPARQVLVRCGQTVVYRSFDAAKREVMVFVTPRTIRSPRKNETGKIR